MRIVFASLGSLGDLHPLLAMAREAERRGHTAVIAASQCFGESIEAQGFSFARIRPDLTPAPERLSHLSHPTHGPSRLMREEIFPSVRATFDDLRAAARDADLLVVGELLYVAPLVARVLGIPWVNVVLAPSSFLSTIDPCVLAPVAALYRWKWLGNWPHRIVLGLGRRVTARWSRPLQALRRELGCPDAGNPIFDGKHSPHRVLACFPEFFAAPQEDWPAQVEQCGFVFFEQSANPATTRRIEAFLAKGDRPIVFTLGSTAVHIAGDFYEWAASVTKRLGRRAILLKGRAARNVAESDDLLVLDYAPLEQLLPRACAVVHHGGIGSCAEALRFQVPSLVIPFGYDQPDNAERLRRLGVARVLPRRRCSERQLLRELTALLDGADTQRPTLARLGAAIDPAGSVAAAIDALEAAAAARSNAELAGVR